MYGKLIVVETNFLPSLKIWQIFEIAVHFNKIQILKGKYIRGAT